ncbi:hypothetical protein LHV13_04210 [Ferrovum sp. PN-J185]|uniref:GNAT family N-acetyltransferase n=1 Tax=Ferrovum sp. PN-J185 TaxID=1356306 RepID=UPI00079369D5|nr:hypothetical protein [Ferrovum sp. PN-J185]KXW56439.1 hypothetical protein FV185_03880 [Ferrovum sp. PN-J185]MCC6068380.1 hypothetical protein [Ferrovum sp. PN-J185]
MSIDKNIGVKIDVATEHDLNGILALQSVNHFSNGGSLSAFIPHPQLILMMEALPQIVARQNGLVIGFLLSSTVEMCKDIPILQSMLEAYPERTHDAYAYGPICIAASERGKGLAQEMYTRLRCLLPGREGVLFIRSDNESSLRAHRKMGMREVSHFDFAGIDHTVLSYIG